MYTILGPTPDCNYGRYWVCAGEFDRIPYHSKYSSYANSDPNDPDYYQFWKNTDGLFYRWFFHYSNSKRKKLLRKYKEMNTANYSTCTANTIVNPEVKDTGWVNTGPGAYVRSIVATGQISMAKLTSPEKEDTMITDHHNVEKSQRDFLERELNRAYQKHHNAIEKRFLGEDHPESVQDAIERIKEGKFKLHDKNHRPYSSWDEMFIWRTEDQDQKGFLASKEKLEAEYKTAMQDLKILDVEKGLKAVRSFEKATFH